MTLQIRPRNDLAAGAGGASATRDQMRARTDWGSLLPPAGEPQPAAAIGVLMRFALSRYRASATRPQAPADGTPRV
jgi:hypothetical protein